MVPVGVGESMASICPLGERKAPEGKEEQRNLPGSPLPGERKAPGAEEDTSMPLLGKEAPGEDAQIVEPVRPQRGALHLQKRRKTKRKMSILIVVVRMLATIFQFMALETKMVMVHTMVDLEVSAVPVEAMEELRMAMEDLRHQDRVVTVVTHYLIHLAAEELPNGTLTTCIKLHFPHCAPQSTLLTSWRHNVFQCS